MFQKWLTIEIALATDVLRTRRLNSADPNERHTDKRRSGRVILIKNLHSFWIVYWSNGKRVPNPYGMSHDLGNERVPDVVIPREQMTFIETGRFEVRKTFGIRRLRARWNFCVQLCRKTALPGNETVMGVNFNTFLTFWADMRRLRCFCLCVTGFEKLCTRYRPRDSVIACRPCVIIVLRGTLAWTPPNICDLASVLPVVSAWSIHPGKTHVCVLFILAFQSFEWRIKSMCAKTIPYMSITCVLLVPFRSRLFRIISLVIPENWI